MLKKGFCDAWERMRRDGVFTKYGGLHIYQTWEKHKGRPQFCWHVEIDFDGETVKIKDISLTKALLRLRSPPDFLAHKEKNEKAHIRPG